MSTRSAAIKYKPGAVHGSMAYDLNNPELYPEYTYGTPLDIPAAPELAEEAVAAPRKVSAQAVSPVAVIGFAIAAVLIVFSLFARIQLTAASAECVKLESSLAQLQDQKSKLLIAYESSINLPEIEDYAVNVLGMQKPRSDQVYYISGSVQDKAVVLGKAAESVGFVDRVGDFLSSLAEYFR